ncbi:hypothetical protein BKA93DRAFT_732516, partial [Sparassis latifolia]
VQGCIYRVHRHHLEEDSDYFRRLFLLRSPEEGRCDETAFILRFVTQLDFDCLLNFLYYGVYEPETLILNEWIILLSVATQLEFARVRRWAIRALSGQLDAMSPVEVIVLAMKHSVPEWLAAAYGELCRRPHPLDDDEAEQLGARTAARIANAREVLREETFSAHLRRRYGCSYVQPAAYDDDLVSKVVIEVFWPEMAETR